MSDPGQPQQTPSAAQISRAWLRDAVVAFQIVVRPITILATGVAVALAAARQPQMWEIVAIAAGVATGVSYFRTMDKSAEIGGKK